MWWFGYPGGLRGWLKDWRMGWDADDLAAAQQKVRDAAPYPGNIIWLTHRELRALIESAHPKPNEREG